jgi:hypothetical protein
MVNVRPWPPLVIPALQPPEPSPAGAIAPFITLARHPGTAAWDLGYDLVNAINSSGHGGSAWACWDRELAQEVAADCHVPASIVESEAYAVHSWLDDMIEGITYWPDPQYTDMTKVFHHLAELVQRLALMGHVVLVGHGARYLTRHLPNGRHVHLLTPREQWAKNIAERRGISLAEAAKLLHELQRNGRAFQHRFLPGLDLSPEHFALTLNTAVLSNEQLTQCLLPLAWPQGIPQEPSARG